MSAANSAARKRSRPSSSAARDSRVPDQSADGMSEATMSEAAVPSGSAAQDPRAGGRAVKAREELAAVPSQDLPGDLAVADDLDADADLDGDDLEGEVNLEDLEELSEDDLGDDALVVEDLEITETPEADLAEADLPDEQEGEEPRPAVAGAEGAAAPAEGKAPGEGGDDEIFVFGDDDEDLPAAQVAVAGATADPVKDYLKQIGKVPLLNAEQEVELAKRIEAGLFAEEKLAESHRMNPD
ncbi:MAG TPA: sigma-70 factor domain-containing protein, partial [Trebonia sp.]